MNSRQLRGDSLTRQDPILEKSTRNHEEVEEEFMEVKRRHSALVAQLAGKSAESSQQTVKLVNKSAENERVRFLILDQKNGSPYRILECMHCISSQLR